MHQPHPLVTVVVPHHLDQNQRYLDLCLDSIINQQDSIDFEVIVISDAKNAPSVPPGVLLIHVCDGTADHFARKINMGAFHRHEKSEAILIASDDVILGRDSIKNMYTAVTSYNVICNAISNCDDINFVGRGFEVERTIKTRLPDGKFEYVQKRLELKRHVDVEYTRGFEREIMEYNPAGVELIIPVKTLYFYATMISTRVWEMVGPLDDEFKSGYEDSDYSVRCVKAGVRPIVTTGAFIFHYGGKTVDFTRDDSKPDLNRQRFLTKHGEKYRHYVDHSISMSDE